MLKNIKLYTLGVLIFLLLLELSGTDTPFATLLYPLAFIIPSAGLLLLTRNDNPPKLSRELPFSLLIPATAPAILLIFGVAYLTAFVIFKTTGAQSPVIVTGEPFFDIVTLAIAPAVFEELLFRYVPLKIIAPYSKKSALLISSLFFALVHSSFFSIPHAAIAGAIFMTADLLAASPIPSVILHLANNLFSIVWEYTYADGIARLSVIALLVLALISLVIMLIQKKKYIKSVRSLFRSEDKLTLPTYTLALLIPTLLAAILELIGK